MKNLEKKIIKEKSFRRNSYNFSDTVFRYLWCGSIAFILSSLLEPFLSGFTKNVSLIIIATAAIFIFVIGLMITRRKNDSIIPYTRQENYNFIGLHNLTAENINPNNTDVLTRTEEIECIHNLLETVIFPQNDLKQAICITGKSGCGKSTILAFFQQKFEKEYNIYNFSGNYNTLETALVTKFETYNIRNKIKEMASNGQKIVFIFDQFERYFFLSSERQSDIRNFIASLCMRNTAIIASMREEYLAEFLREFDLNDIKSNYKTNEEIKHSGLLRRLIGYTKHTENYVVINGSRRKITFSKWKNDRIKSPEYLHVCDPENEKISLDKTDSTIFYCENQNNLKTDLNSKNSVASLILNKCIERFKDKGEKLYNCYRNKPLIEQQIIFHMSEFDQDIRDYDSVEEFCKFDSTDIIKRYFDIQLSSTNDYFNASRVMYMLSSSRLHQISMKTDEIIRGLNANQFFSKGKKQIETVIKKLEKLQLIRKNTSNSDLEYEIAHDYIASSFLNYSRANMDRNVKSALDIFLADFIEEYEEEIFAKDNETIQKIKTRKENRNEKVQRRIKADGNFYKALTWITGILIVCIDVIYRFFWNPWETVISTNPMAGIFPIFVPIHILLSVFYFYQYFDKVFKYYDDKKTILLKLEYIFLALLALFSEACYPHFVLSDGMGLAMLGATAYLLLNKDYREASRAAMRSYGIKCIVGGSAFLSSHLLFVVSQNTFPIFLIAFEMIAETILVGYGHLSHTTKEYLYGRSMDVSGNKIR